MSGGVRLTFGASAAMLRPTLLMSTLAAAATAAAAATTPSPGSPHQILFFDMDTAVKAESLSYEEQLLAYVFQGLVNDASLDAPALMFDAGYMNFDW